MARGKKNARRLGAHIVFVDEAGFLLIPSVRRTWAPRGHTPVLRHRYRHDRISVISGLSVSPRRHRMSLYFQLHDHNIRQMEVCEFLQHLLHHLRGPVIVLWDNANIHGGEALRDLCRRVPRLHLERLPAYAPELNPDEGVWKHAKHELANGCPLDLEELWENLLTSLAGLRKSQKRMRGCVHQTQLPSFMS